MANGAAMALTTGRRAEGDCRAGRESASISSSATPPTANIPRVDGREVVRPGVHRDHQEERQDEGDAQEPPGREAAIDPRCGQTGQPQGREERVHHDDLVWR